MNVKYNAGLRFACHMSGQLNCGANWELHHRQVCYLLGWSELHTQCNGEFSESDLVADERDGISYEEGSSSPILVFYRLQAPFLWISVNVSQVWGLEIETILNMKKMYSWEVFSAKALFHCLDYFVGVNVCKGVVVWYFSRVSQ